VWQAVANFTKILRAAFCAEIFFQKNTKRKAAKTLSQKKSARKMLVNLTLCSLPTTVEIHKTS